MKIEEIEEEIMATKEDLTAEESLSLGDSMFVDEDFVQAVDAYAVALAVLREDDPKSNALKIRILSHRSAAFYRLRNYNDALEDALEALEVLRVGKNIAGLRPGESELCHKRAGVAYANLNDYKNAKEQFEKAQQLATLNRGDEKAYKTYIKQCEYSLKPKQTSPSPMMEAIPAKTASSSAPTTATSSASKSTTAKAAVSTKTASKKPAPKIPTQPKPSASESSNNKNVPVSTIPKYQYYQDDKVMTIQIIASNVKPENLNVQFERKHLTVILNNHTVICGDLYCDVDVEHCKTKIKEEKVLIKLKKVDLNYEWPELMSRKGLGLGATPKSTAKSETAAGETKTDDGESETKAPAATTASIPVVDKSKPTPYASHRDWDAIEKELTEQEKEEKPEGDEAMNKLFQTIYASADEDTRRAMIKSYQTSGGTVLSTNWGEVKEKDYEKERTAPKGQEWKTWNGEKLPTVDDD